MIEAEQLHSLLHPLRSSGDRKPCDDHLTTATRESTTNSSIVSGTVMEYTDVEQVRSRRPKNGERLNAIPTSVTTGVKGMVFVWVKLEQSCVATHVTPAIGERRTGRVSIDLGDQMAVPVAAAHPSSGSPRPVDRALGDEAYDTPVASAVDISAPLHQERGVLVAGLDGGDRPLLDHVPDGILTVAHVVVGAVAVLMGRDLHSAADRLLDLRRRVADLESMDGSRAGIPHGHPVDHTGPPVAPRPVVAHGEPERLVTGHVRA